jgi:hypothetical protein
MNTDIYALLVSSPWTEALQIAFFGLVTSCILYFFTGWIFRYTGIEKLIHKFLGHGTRIGRDPLPRAIGKYIAVFVFLLFLRYAFQKAGYHDLEKFIGDIVAYFPYLLLALLITFFGIQASRTIYVVVYNAVHFENPRTAAILAQIARIAILFFTFTIVINLINTGIEIIPEYLVRSVLIWFVAAVSLAFGLAFGLGGRESASQIIHEYLNKKEEEQKNLKNGK